MVFNRKNPYLATLAVNRCLTKEGSDKETRHYEVDIDGSGLTYEVGDSLAVMPRNDPRLVDEILEVLGFSGDEPVAGADKSTTTVREALLSEFQITQIDKKLLKAVAEKDSSAAFLNDLVDSQVRTELDKYLWGREVVDLLHEFGDARFEPGEFVALLKKLQIRLYSIASSQRACPTSVHLTVATVRYESLGRPRGGVCSTYLAERADPPNKVPVFVHTAKHFRLPEDPATDVIMVGPGTGIALFRGFLQERAATRAPGRNWLYFGDRHLATDFLYQDELEAWLDDGTLARLDTAFSRDQDHKIYVQDRILEAADEMWAWLENGAYFYVCGDASRMAPDVDRALHQLIEKAGHRTPEQAEEVVSALKKEKRYRRDVY